MKDLPRIELDQPTVYVLVGVPGVGKSTTVKNMLDDPNMYDAVVVSLDHFLELFAERESITYNESFHRNAKMADSLMKARARQLLREGRTLVWDQTNLTPKKRAQVIRTVDSTARRGVQYKRVAVVVQCPDEYEHMQRLAGRKGKIIPKDVLASMVSAYTEPSYDEGFDEIILVNTVTGEVWKKPRN